MKVISLAGSICLTIAPVLALSITPSLLHSPLNSPRMQIWLLSIWLKTGNSLGVSSGILMSFQASAPSLIISKELRYSSSSPDLQVKKVLSWWPRELCHASAKLRSSNDFCYQIHQVHLFRLKILPFPTSSQDDAAHHLTHGKIAMELVKSSVNKLVMPNWTAGTVVILIRRYRAAEFEHVQLLVHEHRLALL